MAQSERISAAPPGSFGAATQIEPAFDPAAFEELALQLGIEGAAEVREVFKSETEARLRRFHSMSLASERNEVEREAHSLKSAAESFGYHRLAKLALRLEKHAARLTGAEYLDLLRQMDAAFAAAMMLEAQS